jgi:hypothetical protein
MLTMQIFEQPSDVETRLGTLGLRQELLHEALRQANLYRARLTAHHPRLYRYQVMSGETVAALRDQLAPLGWEKSDDGNYELSVHGTLNIAIAVASGDSGTGHASRTPSNRSPKGRHTVHAVETNRQQDLFAELLPQKPQEERCIETWVLLHNVTSTEIKAELSRPSDINEDGKITAWSERIILGSLPLDCEKVQINSPKLPDIDITISRKSAGL